MKKINAGSGVPVKKTIIYIDGEAGTTGLKIRSRLENRDDVELLAIAPELRKDVSERKRLINAADFVFLCLPDEAAREAVSFIDNPLVRVIDASTAHRTNPDWVYGFPELTAGQADLIRGAKRVSVPGCYASGFIALIRPLTEKGILPRDFPVTAYGISGYSGAGKAAIAEYEIPPESREAELSGARLYALTQEHKHLPEMKLRGGLTYTPAFNPIIDDFYSGMVVCAPVVARTLPKKYTAGEITAAYRAHYPANGRVKIVGEDYDKPFLAANALSGSDDMELFVFGDKDNERLLLTARLDNLGKGASGAAVQCFDIMANR